MPRLLTLLLVLLSTLVAPLCADALTLDVTGGNVTLSSASSFEPGVAVYGNGWSLQGFSGSSFTSISGTMFFHATTLVLHGATFSGQCCDNNSTMMFDVDLSAIHPLGVEGFQPSHAGFTMTGLLGIGPGGAVDLVGQGFLNITRIQIGAESILAFSYDFTPPQDVVAVSEAPTPLLLMFGIVLAAGLRFALGRMRRPTHH